MISVIYSTREDNQKHLQHIKDTCGVHKMEVIQYINNGEYSLTELYNKALQETTNNIVVFCHDDIIFETNNWGKKLLKNFDENKEYGVIGIAGTTDIDETGRWWNDNTKMVGVVKHRHNGKTWENKYSGIFNKKIIETVIVDGLFFAVNKDRIKENFDEDVKGFHFYEIDFCFRNHIKGVKIGVTFDVRVIHKSIGQTNDEWESNRVIFSDKFKEELPLNINVNPITNEKPTRLKSKPNIKILIHSNGDRDKVVKICNTIKDMGYENYKIVIVLSVDATDPLEDINLENVEVTEGMYSSLHKNISILKWDDEIISDDDELYLFLSDDIDIKTNILYKFVYTYLNNKKTFGGIFPKVLNQNNTILSTGVDILSVIQNNKANVQCNLKGINSYYNYNEGCHKENLGNVGFCFMTTKNNLDRFEWFRLDFDSMFYESHFSSKCVINKKDIYVDNDSVVQLPYNFFEEEEKKSIFNKDMSNLVRILYEDKKTKQLMKIVKMNDTQPQL